MAASPSPEARSPAPVPREALRLLAADGYPLAADLFAPAGAPRATALVAPAMGVRRGFYVPLARYLAEAGILSLSLDYRGMGDSRPASLRGFPARLRDWGERDLAAGVGELSRRAPRVPLLWVGHSVGGQLLGLLPEAPVRAAVFLGSQSGWSGHWSGFSRAVMAALWWGVIRASTAVAGYLPMRALGQGEDVPAGVAREWASWGRHRRYIGRYADAGGARLRPLRWPHPFLRLLGRRLRSAGRLRRIAGALPAGPHRAQGGAARRSGRALARPLRAAAGAFPRRAVAGDARLAAGGRLMARRGPPHDQNRPGRWTCAGLGRGGAG